MPFGPNKWITRSATVYHSKLSILRMPRCSWNINLSIPQLHFFTTRLVMLSNRRSSSPLSLPDYKNVNLLLALANSYSLKGEQGSFKQTFTNKKNKNKISMVSQEDSAQAVCYSKPKASELKKELRNTFAQPLISSSCFLSPLVPIFFAEISHSPYVFFLTKKNKRERPRDRTQQMHASASLLFSCAKARKSCAGYVSLLLNSYIDNRQMNPQP